MERIKELYDELLPWEKTEFCDWLFKKGVLGDEVQAAIEDKVQEELDEVLDDKYEEWRLGMIDRILEMI